MNKRKIIAIADPYSTGHHLSYNKLLVEAARRNDFKVVYISDRIGCKYINEIFPDTDIFINEIGISNSKISREVKKIVFYIRAFQYCRRRDIACLHIAYIDRSIFSIALANSAIKIDKLLITLHWNYFSSPENNSLINRLETKIFSWLSRGSVNTNVHSGLIVDDLYIHNIKSKYTPYPIAVLPSITSHEENKLSCDGEIDALVTLIRKADVSLLCFGGMRYDKGADLAVHLLESLPEYTHLFIVGKPEYFSKEYLNNLAMSLGVESRMHVYDQYIADDDIQSIFNACSIVCLPYRESFSGQSGPLTIAASLGKPILASNNRFIAFEINNQSIGEVFDSLSFHEVNRAFIKALEKSYSPKEFIEKHDPERFIESIGEMYKVNND
ncbi:glycosyltransferase [Deinococcus sp. ME38]